MRVKKRGQITYFIIAGIAIMIIVGFVLYMRSSLVKKETEEEVERVKEQAFSTAPVENYVTNCLKLTAENALELLGKQGGVIYNTEGGTIAAIGTEGISYIQYGNCYPLGGANPCRTRNNINHLAGQPHNNFRPIPICKYNDCKTSGPILNLNSMQENIEKYTLTHLGDCMADMGSAITSQFEVDYQSTPNSINVEITSKNIVVNLNYPMEIEEKATGKKEKVERFKSIINVRLNELYDFIDHIINRDVSDPEYNIGLSRDEFESKLVLDGGAPFLTGTKNTVIEVLDKKDPFKGKDYSFIFGRSNRKPTLTTNDWIVTAGTINFNSDFPNKIDFTRDPTIRTDEMRNLAIELIAFDSDDDRDEGTLTYSIYPSGPLSRYTSYTGPGAVFYWNINYLQGRLAPYIFGITITDKDGLELKKEIKIGVENSHCSATAANGARRTNTHTFGNCYVGCTETCSSGSWTSCTPPDPRFVKCAGKTCDASDECDGTCEEEICGPLGKTCNAITHLCE